MTRRLLGKAAVAMVLGQAACGAGAAPDATVGLREAMRAPKAEPIFSFVYGDRRSPALMAGWKVVRSQRKLDADRTEVVRSWRDAETGLLARCVGVQYADFPCVEWTVYLRNEGPRDTPLIEGLQAIDTVLRQPAAETCVLHHATGSPCTATDYRPWADPLPAGTDRRIATAGGRSTNSDLPFFNLEARGGGTIVALGWPGQWAVRFTHTDDGVRVAGGQEATRFVLRPGEEVRTPLVAVLSYRGDWIDGQNAWRRWMLAHNVPKVNGAPPAPQMAACSSHQFGEMIHADEASQETFIDRYLAEGIKLDYWWMDAGWYVNNGGWPNTGTWEVDTKRFPRGLRHITDHGHARGVRSIVWFEPERVDGGTWLAETHPEWLLSDQPDRASSMAGLVVRRSDLGGPDPCVTYNTTDHPIAMGGIRWEPGRLAFHPGPNGEYSVVRWTAPAAGRYQLKAAFTGIDQQTTTDVHVLLAGASVYEGFINLNGDGRRAELGRALDVKAGDAVDFVVGWGNGTLTCDSTGLEAAITGPDGAVREAARAFAIDRNPNGEWSYGWLAPGGKPDASTFRLYTKTGRASEGGQRLLNLGNPEARQWLVEHVDGLIRSQGIDLYRTDFNIDPLGFWRANDAPDRQGITEIRYVEGLLAYWDELRRRHPGMLIDTCASGGRRNDLEALRRAVPLLRSDYILEPVGQQNHTYGIAMWIPFYGTGVNDASAYNFRSQMCPHLTGCYDVRRTDLDYPGIRTLYGQWRALGTDWYGDFYPLTPYSPADDAWMAWQFHRPETGTGFVQAFRRAGAQADSLNVKLRGLKAGARYAVKDADTGQERMLTGKELAERGLEVRLPTKPGAALITYRPAGGAQ